MGQAPSPQGRRAFVLTALAFAWSVGLVVAALALPVYGRATLVDENGSRVLLVVAVPAVVSAVVWVALRRRCTRGGRVSDFIAWASVSLLLAFCIIAMFSIGPYVAPVALLLARAAMLTPSGSESKGAAKTPA